MPISARFLAVCIALALGGAACQARPGSEINEFEARFDAAARDSSGGTLDLGATVPEVGWDRAFVLGCSDIGAMQEAIGVKWEGLAFIEGVDELCDDYRQTAAFIFIKGNAVTGWGLTNMADDGTRLKVDLLTPAQIRREAAVLDVFLDLGCASKCPVWILRPAADAEPG